MINSQNFKALSARQEDNCVSIYIPTYRANHVQEDHLRFKNALSDAVKQLTQKGMDKNQAHGFLNKAYDLLENRNFWRHLSEGLAVFIGQDFFEHHIIPVDVNPMVYVGTEFYLRPLIPALTEEARFFVLALSQDEVRFFEGSKHSITPVNIDDLVPENIMEATFNEQEQEQLFQSTSAHQYGPKTLQGHGDPIRQPHRDLYKYFRYIDEGLMKMLHDEQAPLLIAAVDYLVPIYKEVTTYKYIVEDHIGGNPEGWDALQLHEEAWSKIGHYFKANQEQAKEDFGLYLSQNKASFSINEVVPAAINGRIQTLFVDKDQETWGVYTEENNAITIHDQQQENSVPLLELAAKRTLLNGGTVYNIAQEDMPQSTAEVNALFRY